MILRSGVDLIEIERIAGALERHGERFLRRIYTLSELAEYGDNAYQRVPSLAGCFAAKEAAAKCLGTGIGDVSWQDIEILHESSGQPVLYLYGQAQQVAHSLSLTSWSVSISHTHAYAVALVIATG